MDRINDRDIFITRHPTDGFTLGYIDDSCIYYKQRYIDYGIAEAKRRFKEYVREEYNKQRILTNQEAK